jgi:hypothetical protein
MSENEKHNMVIGPEAEAKARAHREKLFREEAETLARRVKRSAEVFALIGQRTSVPPSAMKALETLREQLLGKNQGTGGRNA